MSLTYLILAHQRPEQLVRLVEQLSADDTTFLIHFNRLSDDRLFEQLKHDLTGNDQVLFMKRHATHWGSFSLTRAVLRGLRRLRDDIVSFDHVKLLSGQDYPLQPAERIRHYFADRQGLSFINHFPLPTDKWRHGGMDRIDRWHLRALGRRWAFAPKRRAFLPGLRPYGGFGYWCLSREAILYALDYLEHEPNYTRYFRFVRLPDELFFHTLLANSPLKSKLINDELTYTEWPRNNGGHPADLGLGSLPQLCSSKALFARKFDMNADSAVLDEIDRHLLSLEPQL